MSERNIKVGYWLWLILQSYRQQTVAYGSNQILASKYFDPFKVITIIDKSAYKLQYPPSIQIHDVFQVSQLRPVVGDVQLVIQLP